MQAAAVRACAEAKSFSISMEGTFASTDALVAVGDDDDDDGNDDDDDDDDA